MIDNTAFKFTSKADTLNRLSTFPELNIPKVFAFTVKDWRESPEDVLANALDVLGNEEKIAVRSSCKREDSSSSSGAGAFLSLLSVPLHEPKILAKAIEEVINSYGDADGDDQVLLQPMVRNPVVTGVIMTRALADGSPYYVINYDDESGQTDTVTGGTHIGKTVYVYRTASPADFDSARLASFVELARRIEEICATDLLDIEFCLDSENVLHLLQTRPICAASNWPDSIPDARIEGVAQFVEAKTGPCPGLFGQRSILGVMPDWNPAEMIGILPRPLASSLYRNLITSHVWSKARERMGYRPMHTTELMSLILGRPYIDVRASLNSFLPRDIDPVTCEALVNAWLERLDNNPQLHDKVEFEVAQTALDFSFENKMDERYRGLLSSSRRRNFREALRALTETCMDISPRGSLALAMDAISELNARQLGRRPIEAHNPGSLHALRPLLAECRKYGTLPFSVLARHAFIAESLLRSAVARDAISAARVQQFKLSIRTIAGEISDEFQEVCEGRRDGQTFLRKYGHLRPGSYDILSPRYSDRPELFSGSSIDKSKEEKAPFTLSEAEKKNLILLLGEHGLPEDTDGLLNYARLAISGREYAKFIFSRNLSDILEILAHAGSASGFSRDDISFLDIQSFLDWTESAWPETREEFFGRRIAYNRELFARASGLKLGYLIRSPRDVYISPQHRAAPNYVGSGNVTAPVAYLAASSSCSQELSGKVVCIENADPGFDWIFTRGIAGLVTRFGGANSHMAIRCAEYGLPAAIGVGERLFEMAANAQRVFLDPGAAILKAQ